MKRHFLIAGGGTGGHVVPGLAVARELQSRGHSVSFIGTQRGIESKLVPVEGFPIDYVNIGGLNRVGLRKMLTSLSELPLSVMSAARVIESRKAAAVFSTGGYVAGPALLAALWKRRPIVVLEPNAVPGFTHRKCGPFVSYALLGFSETQKWFPSGRSEVTGMPVREQFFSLPTPPSAPFTVLVTGGSQGARTLNRAVAESLPLWKREGVRVIHQSGMLEFEDAERVFRASGVSGEVRPFLPNIADAYAQAHVVVSRSGMGALSEIAAAGRPSVLVPFPGAADNHQLHNARAFAAAGASYVVLDSELTGEKLFQEVLRARENAAGMAAAARELAHPGAARRAADVLEKIGLDLPAQSRNNT